jgi:hypothetical protein
MSMTSARPPTAATGSPPPMTLPKVTRSGTTVSRVREHLGVAARGGAEPGEHLVADQQGALAAAELGDERGEPGCRGDNAHVRRRRLGDHGGDAAGVRGEDLLQRGTVVVRDDERLRRDGLRHAGRARQCEGRQPRPGGGQQTVGVTVVVARELDEQVASGRAARQADGGHGRLGARGDQPRLLHGRHPSHDLLDELRLGRGRRPERQSARGGGLDGGDDLGMGVAEQRRPQLATRST